MAAVAALRPLHLGVLGVRSFVTSGIATRLPHDRLLIEKDRDKG